MATSTTPSTSKLWHESFPAPQSTAEFISRETVLGMLRSDQRKSGHDFLIIDLRRSDHEAGSIRGSLNLPAQTIWHSLDTLYNLCDAACLSSVIFYCGSSRGRGPRAAGWFQDLLAKCGNTKMKSLVLAEGIKGWLGAGDEYTQFVDGHDIIQQKDE